MTAFLLYYNVLVAQLCFRCASLAAAGGRGVGLAGRPEGGKQLGGLGFVAGHLAVDLGDELGLGFAEVAGQLLGVGGAFGPGGAGGSLLGLELGEGIAQLGEVGGGHVEVEEGRGVGGAVVEDEAGQAHEVGVGLAFEGALGVVDGGLQGQVFVGGVGKGEEGILLPLI